ncbi:MAG: hypothetical protein WBA69_08765 [Mycobacterium sp.]
MAALIDKAIRDFWMSRGQIAVRLAQNLGVLANEFLHEPLRIVV